MGGPRGRTQMADLAWHSQYATLNANLFGMCKAELTGRILMCQIREAKNNPWSKMVKIFYVNMNH